MEILPLRNIYCKIIKIMYLLADPEPEPEPEPDSELWPAP